MPFPPFAACRFFDLPPVNLQNLPLHLTKKSFASAPTHLCGIALNIFWAFAEGFIKETAATLTEAEVNTLGISCFALSCELATRFLDDYILGDKYFKIKYPEHNLVRTRCQIALAKDMRKKMDAMNAIARDCWERYR